MKETNSWQLLECLLERLTIRFKYLACGISGGDVFHFSVLDPPQSLFPIYRTDGRANRSLPERHFEPQRLSVGVIFFKPYPVISDSLSLIHI